MFKRLHNLPSKVPLAADKAFKTHDLWDTQSCASLGHWDCLPEDWRTWCGIWLLPIAEYKGAGMLRYAETVFFRFVSASLFGNSKEKRKEVGKRPRSLKSY